MHIYVLLRPWGAECMHFYVVFAYLGVTLYAFLRGIRIPGGHFVCIFTWYSHTWGALCMHFYVVFACLEQVYTQSPCTEPNVRKSTRSPVNQSTSKAGGLFTSQPGNRFNSQPVRQLTSQQVNQTTSQPANQLTRELLVSTPGRGSTSILYGFLRMPSTPLIV